MELILDHEFTAIVMGQVATLRSLAHMAATPEDSTFIKGQIEAIKNMSISCGMYTPQVQQAVSEIQGQLLPTPPAWLALPEEVSRD